MSSIDERVVKMTFDNDDFEKDIKTSSDSLSKFKESLNDKTTADGLDNVSKSLSNISFTNVLSGIENMTSKFSVFGVSAATIIQDITRKLETMADTMVSAITTDPMTAGWDEYELKMNSVAVIMNSTGESIDTVNQYLDELNEYADQTIYSFSDMTENIGKFTNAGVSLEDAVTAIRGISNEAALSGATATQASNAMYNFAQALSTGYVALIDWKSIENAQMATQEFKQQLLDTAVACGTVEETADGMYQVLTTNASGSTLSDAINATEGFRDSLSYQWLTTEVLIETLKDYGDETTEIGAKASEAATEVKTFSMLIDTLKEAMGSGWTETWENIFGDYETAKAGWTSVSNLLGSIIDNSATKRNLKVSEAMNTTWSQLQQKFVDAGASAEDFNSTMTELAINTGLVTQDMIDSMGGLENTISKGWLTTDLLNDAISSLFGTTSADAEDATAALSDYQDIVTEIIRGTYGNGSDRQSALEELGYDYEALQTIVNAVWDGSEINWDNYTEEALIAAGATEEEAAALMEMKDSLNLTDEELQQFVDDLNSGKKSGTELLWESITNTIEGLSRILGSIGSAWTNVFGTLSSGTIYNVIASIESFTEKLLINEETARNLQRTFRGLFSVLSIIKTTVTTIASRTFKALSNVLGDLDIDVLSITGKIGNAIDKFRLWYESSGVVNDVIDAMVPLIKLAGSAVKELVSQFKSIPQVQTLITAIKNAFSGLDDEIQNGFPTLQKWIENFIDWLKSLDGLTLDDIKQGFKDLFTTVKNGDVKFEFPNLSKLADTFPNIAATLQKAVDKITEVFQTLSSWVSGGATTALEETGEGVTTLFEALGSVFNSVISVINSGVGQIDVGSIISIAVSLVSIYSAFSLLSSIKKFANAARDIGDFFDTLNAAVSGWTTMKVNTSTEKEINNFRSIAISIGVLLAAVVVIGNQSLGDIAKGIAAIGLVSAIAFGLQAASGALKKAGLASGSLSGIGGTVIAMSAALLIVVQAIKQLNGISVDDGIQNSLAIVISVIGMLALCCIALQTNSGVLEKGQRSANKATTTLIAFAIALKLITSSLKDLVNMDYKDDDLRALEDMILLLTLACAALGKVGTGLNLGSAASLIAIPIALKLVISAFDDLAELKYDSIISAIPKIGIILTEMAAMMLLTNLGGSTSDAGTILALAASTIIIAQSMKMLADIDSSAMDQAIIGLVAVTGCLEGLMSMSKVITTVVPEGSKVKSGLGTLIGVTVAIIAMAGSMIMLAQIDENKLANASGAIVTLSGCLAVIEGLSSAATGSFGTIVGLATAIAILAASVGLLANFTDASSLQNATDCLTQIMGMFALLEVVSKLTVTSESLLTFAATLGSLAVVLAVIGVVLGVMSECTNAGSLATTAASLTTVMLGLAVLAVATLAIPSDIVSATTKALGLIELIAVLVGVCAVLGVLQPYLGDIASGGALMLGDIIGSFVRGVQEGLSGDIDGLEEKGNGVTSFIEAITPAIDSLSSVDSNIVQNASALASALLAICGAELLDAITNFITGDSDMTTFGAELVAFGTAIKKFAAETEGISYDSLSGAIGAAEALVELEKTLPKSGGLFQLFSGSYSWTTIGDGLDDFGKALKKYAKRVSGEDFDAAAIESSASAASALVEVLQAIPSEGGFLDGILGTSEWSTVGNGLAEFGKAMSDYSKAITGDNAIDAATISSSASAASALVEVLDAIPETGGFIDKLFGEKSWSSIGTGLASFGRALASYCTAVSGETFDAQKITESASAATALTDVFKNMPKSSTISNKLGDSETWTKLSPVLVAFANTLAEMSAVTGISSTNLDKIATAATSLVSIKDNAPKASALANKFNPTSVTWEDISGYITVFADMMADISKSSASVSASNIDSLASAATSLKTLKEDTPKASTLKDKFNPSGTTWDKISEYITKFVTMLVNISSYSGSVKPYKINTLATAASYLSLLNNNVPDVYYLGQKFVVNGDSEYDWTTVGDAIITFANMYTEIADANISENNLDALVDAAKSMKQLKNNMPALSGWDSLVGTDEGSSWTEVASGIVAFALALESLAACANIDVTAIDSAITNLGKLSSVGSMDMTFIGENVVSSIVEGITSSVGSVTDDLDEAAETMMNAFVSSMSTAFDSETVDMETAMSTVSTAMANAGSDALLLEVATYTAAATVLLNAVVTGLSSGTSSVSTTAASVGRAGSVALHSSTIYSGYYNSGVYLIAGLTKGIEAGKSSAVNAAVAVGTAALTALNNALEEESPSKATRRSGEYFDEGLAIGIRNMAYVAANAANDVGDSTLSALDTAADRVNKVLDGRMSFSPTITPVIDLSNVNSGVNAIQGMLGQGYNLDIDTAQISSLSAAMGNIQNGTGNEDVVSAITKLNRTMSKDRQNVYNLGGITYDDGSSVANAVQAIVRAATIERRA